MPKVSSLITRSITGVLYIAIILGAILSNSIVLLGLVLATMVGLACYEYQRVVGVSKFDFILRILHSVMGALAFYVTFVVLAGRELSEQRYLVALVPYFAYYFFYTLGELFRRRENPFFEVSQSFFAHLYVAVPLGFLLALAQGGYENGASLLITSVAFPRTFWVLPVFVFVWLSDTGAFVVGSLLGRRKLFERISPKKTVEGLLGGLFFAMLGGLLFYLALPAVTQWYHWLILALLVAGFATYGDLFESLLKRTYGVKDSGNILPGHGGILDRIDSILFAAIPAYFYVMLFIYN